MKWVKRLWIRLNPVFNAVRSMSGCELNGLLAIAQMTGTLKFSANVTLIVWV